MLITENLGFSIRDERAGKLAVGFRDVNLSIAPGEIVAFLGSSGCGKSTIIKLLGGLVPPHSGRVLCDGAPVVQPRSPVFVVFQDYMTAVFPWMTVHENLSLGCGATASNESVPRAAERMQLGGQLAKYPLRLSGGERQRVQLARALLSQPKYLLLDEPTSSLDVDLRKTLLELLVRETTSATIGVLIVTHNIDEAVFVADRIYLARKAGDGWLSLKEIPGFGRQAPNLGEAHKSREFGALYEVVYSSLFGGN
ncbi:MAG: ATP-binding cassette domain-containing protein [Gemmatimonadales bacterium]|nr:ATP-binding cassette domain-containing protein [Gemmatimonadales bacterium]